MHTVAPDSSNVPMVIETLHEVSRLNPHIAEPYIVRAQLHLVMGDVVAGGEAAETGLKLLCEWGTVWDKRMSWDTWLAWSRVCSQMASRGEAWPDKSWSVINLGLVDSQAAS